MIRLGDEVVGAHLGQFRVAVPRHRRRSVVPAQQVALGPDDVEHVVERVDEFLRQFPLAFEVPFALLARGDVGDEPLQQFDTVVGGPDGPAPLPHPPGLAGRSGDPVGDLERFLGRDGVPGRLVDRRFVGLVNERPPRHLAGLDGVGVVADEVGDAVADELHGPPRFVAGPVHHPREVRDERRQLALGLFEGRLGPLLPDGPPDAVREDGVLVGADVLLEVLGHARRDGVAGYLLVALPGKEDDWQVGELGPDGLEELQPVHPRHVVVADDAVDRRRPEAVERRPRRRLREDGDSVVGAFQMRGGDLHELRVVVDVEDADVARTAHAVIYRVHHYKSVNGLSRTCRHSRRRRRVPDRRTCSGGGTSTGHT